MSGSQKALRIISVLMIVWAIFTILFGAFLAAGSAVPGMSSESVDLDGSTVDMATAALALGIGVVVGGVVNLIIALFGLRGAKNPRKVGAFLVLCIIGLVLGIAGLIMNILQGVFQWTSVVGMVLLIVCTLLASSVKKQA